MNTRASIQPKITPNTTAGDGEDFASLLEKSFSLGAGIEEGEIVKGKVVGTIRDAVIVDFGYKLEGQVHISEFTSVGGEPQINIGEEIDVYIENLECEDGLAILSKEKADALKIWDRLQEVADTNGSIDGVVVAKVKGGLSVDIGVKAFLPGSQIDVRPIGNLDKLIGRHFKVAILKLNKRKGNIIVSRRALLEKDRDFAKNEMLQNIAEGQTVTGTVKNITDYGAFIDLGGIDGLLHITDMTWGRIGHPSEVLAVGQDVPVKILKIDPDSGKVSLGMKQLTPDPWEKVSQNYEVGSRIKGKVVSLADYGAFIEIEKGIEGLVHISEMSWSRKIKHPSKVVTVGDQVECAILDMDPTARRISLGMKQIMENPWSKVVDKYPVGARIKGPVKNVTDFGVFVGLEGDVDGLVHVSDVAWVKPARSLSAAFPKKKEVEAIVLNIDAENERISLGIKQLTDDIWNRVEKQYGIGARHKGKVVGVTEKVIAVETEAGVEGSVLRQELPEEVQADVVEKYPVGQDVEVVVHSLDEKERRLTLGVVLK